MEERRSFDAYGQLAAQEFKVSGATILRITSQRDALGRITARHEERPSGITTFEYAYDPAGRLVSERKILPDGSSLLTQWSYDANGNRVMEVKPDGTVTTGTYDNQDRLLQYGESTFTYTHNGELITKCQGSACQHFAYDVFGNLRHVILDSGIEIEYLIDGRNRRIGKKINGTLVQGFIYDDQLRIVAELDGQNQVVATFVYGDHINVPELIEKGGGSYRILHDHLGSPRFVVDTQTGEIVQEMQYDAWGNVVFDSNPGFQPFGFAGGLYDPQTKLLRFGARDYDPQVGRWTAKDPEFFYGGDYNLGSYCAADPVNAVDPEGTQFWGVCRWLWKWAGRIITTQTAINFLNCIHDYNMCYDEVNKSCNDICPDAAPGCRTVGHRCCDKKLLKCIASVFGFASFGDNEWGDCWENLPRRCPLHGPPPELRPACPSEQ